jgi:hypothetical protein
MDRTNLDCISCHAAIDKMHGLFTYDDAAGIAPETLAVAEKAAATAPHPLRNFACSRQI